MFIRLRRRLVLAAVLCMADQPPLLVAVAPTGARKSKSDHPMIPMTPPELAKTAASCLESGATMMHLHVRDADGRHSIFPEHYTPALEAIANEIGDHMVVQVTSESVGIFDRHQQMQAMRSLMPESVSLALRELVPDDTAFADAAKFFSDLDSAGCLIQYIVYSPEEVDRYHQLIDAGIIPQARNLILVVLGRYRGERARLEDLSPFLARNTSNSPWMCCAFGSDELSIMHHVIQAGGHTRVGFENNTQLVSGKQADSNSQMVALTATAASRYDRPLANVRWLRRVHRELWESN